MNNPIGKFLKASDGDYLHLKMEEDGRTRLRIISLEGAAERVVMLSPEQVASLKMHL
jgi:hypothetical protein